MSFLALSDAEFPYYNDSLGHSGGKKEEFKKPHFHRSLCIYSQDNRYNMQNRTGEARRRQPKGPAFWKIENLIQFNL